MKNVLLKEPDTAIGLSGRFSYMSNEISQAGNTMNTLLRGISLTLILVLTTGCGWFGGGGGGENNSARGGGQGGDWSKKPEKPKFKIPVTVQELERGRMVAYLQAVGTVVPIRDIEVKSEMAGRIYFTKKWKDGDVVKAGDVFATIDDRELRLNINEAELNLELAKNAMGPAKAQLDQARKDEEFNRAMLERGAISVAEFDQAVLARIQQENSYEQTEKNIEARQMALTKLQQELEKVSIVIPFDGVLLPPEGSSVNQEGHETDLTTKQGTIVGSQEVVCRLANIDEVYVALDVPAKDLLQVDYGQLVELDVYSRTGRQYTGTVADISTTLNASTRTYTVNVLVENPENEMRPGMFAKARIITEERRDAISIPRELVLLRNNRNVVFVAKEKPIETEEGREGPGDPAGDEQASEIADDGEVEGRQYAMAGQRDTPIAARESGDDEEMYDDEAGAEEPQVEYIVEEREIVLGIENRERVEVIDGLRAGELLVVLGYETLSDGIDVNVTVRPDDPEALFESQES